MNVVKYFQGLRSQYYTIQIFPEGSSHVRTIRIAHLYIKLISWLMALIGIFALIGFWKLAEINAMLLTSKYLKMTNEKLMERHSEYEAAFQELDSLYAMERQIQNILQTYYSNDSGTIASILDNNRLKRISADQTRLDISRIQEYVMDDRSQFDNAPNILPIIGTISQRFNPKEGHNGIDFSAPRNEPVFSTANGKVIFAGDDGELGLSVRIKHSDDFVTTYSHLGHLYVRKGSSVRKGETIGTVGMTGNTSAPHLHYQILHKDQPINPEEHFNH